MTTPSVFMFMSCRSGRRRVGTPAEELLFLDLLPDLFRGSRVQFFHFLNLLGREPRELTNEVHQMPARVRPLVGSGRPGRHSGQTNAVLDDVEQLTVCVLFYIIENGVRLTG